MVRRRLASALGLAAIAAFVVAGDASAMTNNVPNGDFETAPCGFQGSVVCDWNPLPGTTISWDATNFHTGSHSMQLTGAGPSINVTTIGNICIHNGPGVHPASFWYRTTDATANQVALGANYYLNATCSVSSSGVTPVRTFAPIADGSWHQLTGTLTFPAGTGSVFYSVFEGCNSCSSTLTLNVDDIDVETETTAVTVSSITGGRTRNGVVLRWQTRAEADVLGFHVFRERAGKRHRVDRRLIAAKGSVSGGRYSFVDARAPRGSLTYRLQAVGVDGARTWYGRITIGR